MKTSLAIVLIFFLFGCKSKQFVSNAAASENTEVAKIISGHYANSYNFKTLSIRASAKYEDPEQSHNLQADIRIKKDEIIWINVKFLGLPMAKVLITPEKVSYYEKMNNTFFEGDFRVLSNWIGTDLDFQKVQNVLLGKAIDDLSRDKWNAEIKEQLFQLTQPSKQEIEKSFYFEAGNFLLKKETISQLNKNRALEINYTNHKEMDKIFLPTFIGILASQKEQVAIDIEYKNTTFNEDLNYSFSIPSGYKAIEID